MVAVGAQKTVDIHVFASQPVVNFSPTLSLITVGRSSLGRVVCVYACVSIQMVSWAANNYHTDRIGSVGVPEAPVKQPSST